MRIMWMSRHVPLGSQRLELVKIFGTHELIINTQPFGNAKDIVKRMWQGGCTELVLVAPLSVCQAILKLGVSPIWAEMRTVDCHGPEVEVRANGNREKYTSTSRCYKFIRFRRLVDIKMEFEDFTS